MLHPNVNALQPESAEQSQVDPQLPAQHDPQNPDEEGRDLVPHEPHVTTLYNPEGVPPYHPEEQTAQR